jgi:hypothetical protein
MRMEMESVTSVPKVTCERVCFSRAILDQAMKGVKRKNMNRYGLEGKR